MAREFTRKYKLISNKLIDENGNVVVNGGDDKTKYKHYAVIIKCGHCGQKYFVPIIATIDAENIEVAIEIAKNYPRSKVRCLGACEVSKEEQQIIYDINSEDEFLCNNKLNENSEEIINRRVFDDEIYRTFVGFNYKKDKYKFYIKLAEEYPEEMILQRYFAPRENNGKLDYKRNVNIKKVIKDFILTETFHYGINEKNAKILARYYLAYGKNNELGIKYNDKIISAVLPDGQELKFEIKGNILNKLEEFKNNEKEIEKKECLNHSEKRNTAIDKFNKRLEITKKIIEQQRGEN